MEILHAHRLRRGREGLVVRTVAWSGLLVGIIAALMPFRFGDVTTWTVVAFFGLLAFFYLVSANLANSVGDAVGYRWGLAIFRKHWDRFVAQRDAAGTSGSASRP